MLQDGCLTYPGASSWSHNWLPEGAFFNELLFTALITCLGYQLTQTCLHLGLGQAARREILISDLNMFLLVSNFSFRSVFSSFGCRGLIGRKIFHGNGRSCTAETYSENSIGFHVKAKFFILLTIAPVIHIIGIYLSIENDRVITFQDVGFGGIALGLNRNRPALHPKASNICSHICTNYARRDTPLSQFSRCYEQHVFSFARDIQNDTFVLILRSNETDMAVHLVTPGQRWMSKVFLDLQSGKTPYRLRNTITEDQRKVIRDQALQKMTRSCESEISYNINVSLFVAIDKGKSNLPAIVKCKNYSVEEVQRIADEMLDNVTIRNTERFEVSPFQNDTFTDGSNLDLLVRPTSPASLLIAISIAVLVRGLIGVVLYNNGHLAVETIVKDSLQLKCCDSMLQVEDKVRLVGESAVEENELTTTENPCQGAIILELGSDGGMLD